MFYWALRIEEMEVRNVKKTIRQVVQDKLIVSCNTVKNHVRNICTKLEVHPQRELIDLVEKID